ncbi:MAG: hypothetical protein E7493_02015 [Ruminococcus albus]|nr:hypothetical protein [Ruminococcus albus]
MAATKIFGISATIGSAIAYIADPKKTENGLYISTCMCSHEPAKAAKDFADVTAKGTGRSSVLAQHFIVSFKPGEVTPQNSYELQEYNEVSRQLLKWYPDKHLPTVDELEQKITALIQERSDKNELYHSVSQKSKDLAQAQQTI